MSVIPPELGVGAFEGGVSVGLWLLNAAVGDLSVDGYDRCRRRLLGLLEARLGRRRLADPFLCAFAFWFF